MFHRKNKSTLERRNRLGPKAMSSPVVSSDPVDRKTKQQLFYECNVCILGQQKLRGDERFTQNKAEVLMNRLYDKRQSHCYLYCLEDNIRFEKTKILGTHPRRNFVRYSCIKHVFLFEDKPDVFMLCIDSGRSDRRTYEAFKFKRKEDVLTVCDLIYKASQDPDYLLHDLAPIREMSRLSDSSIPVQYRSTSELEQHSCRQATHVTNSMPVYSREASQSFYPVNDYSSEKSVPKLATAKPVQSTPDKISQNSGVHYMQLKGQPESISRDNLSLEELNEQISKKLDDDEWEVNITYLQWSNEHGATINDRGPVYMYVARRIHPS